MSVEVLRTYRFHCDAAQCNATVLSEASDAPSTWTTISSTDHQTRGPLPSVKSGRARLRAMDAESARSYGRFRLHLCPEHPDALAEHLPQTDNPGGQGVTVSCSCGAWLTSNAEGAKSAWLRHQAQEQTPPAEGDQVT